MRKRKEERGSGGQKEKQRSQLTMSAVHIDHDVINFSL